MQVRLGKKEPLHDKRTLCLLDFVNLDMAAENIPPVLTLSSKLAGGLPMYDNDRIGCCDIASKAHLIKVQSHNDKDAPDFEPTLAQVVDGYRRSGGYDPAQTRPDGSNPTDGGCFMLTTLNLFRKQGLFGKKILGFGAVNPQNPQLVKLAMSTFGGITIGLSLPEAVQGQDNSICWELPNRRFRGRGWQKGSWGGHAVSVFDYTDDILTLGTWGGLKRMTWEFFHEYCDESYFIVSPTWFGIDGKAPNGIGAFELVNKMKSFPTG